MEKIKSRLCSYLNIDFLQFLFISSKIELEKTLNDIFLKELT